MAGTVPMQAARAPYQRDRNLTATSNAPRTPSPAGSYGREPSTAAVGRCQLVGAARWTLHYTRWAVAWSWRQPLLFTAFYRLAKRFLPCRRRSRACPTLAAWLLCRCGRMVPATAWWLWLANLLFLVLACDTGNTRHEWTEATT